MLAGDEDGVAIVRGHVQRERPLEAVAHAAGRVAAGQFGPHLDVPELAVAGVPAHHHTAARTRSRRARPHDVRILGIGGREPALAPAHGDPFRPRYRPADAAEATGAAVAGAAERRSVLPVAEHVVGNRVVHRHVVHLADGQLGGVPRHAPIHGDGHVLVVADDHAVPVQRVDPHVVVVAPGPLSALVVDVGRAPVQGAGETGGLEVDFIRVVGADETVVVVGGASAQVAGVVHQLPRRPSVERTPELAALGLAPVPGHPVAGLDQRVHPIGIGRGQTEVGLPHRQRRQPVAFELPPGVAAILREVDAAALSAALPSPGVHLHGPHPGEEPARVGGVHLDAGSARVLVHEEHMLPALAAVRGAKDAARLLRTVGVAQGSHVYDIRIVRMDDDARHARRPSLAEPHVTPRPACVGGLVDPGSERDVRANVGLARPGPHDRRVRGRYRERPDRVIRLVVEDGLPVLAAVRGLPDPARSRSRVVGQGISGNPYHRGKAVAHRPDVSIPELLVGLRGDLLCPARASESEDHRYQRKQAPCGSQDRVHRHLPRCVTGARQHHTALAFCPASEPETVASGHEEPCLPQPRVRIMLTD